MCTHTLFPCQGGGEEPWGPWNQGRKRRKRETPGITEWGCLASPAGWVCRVKITKWLLEKQINIPVSILKQLEKKIKEGVVLSQVSQWTVQYGLQVPLQLPPPHSPMRLPPARSPQAVPPRPLSSRPGSAGLGVRTFHTVTFRAGRGPGHRPLPHGFPQPENEVPPTRLSSSHAA